MIIIQQTQRHVRTINKIFLVIFIVTIFFSNVKSNCLNSGSGGCFDSGCGKLSNFKDI